MKEKEFTYVDLGLPSGRLWASENAEGYYTYDEAKEKFGELLPKPEAFEELWEECQWLWDVKEKRMVVVGPNQNTIFLHASGYRHYTSGGLFSLSARTATTGRTRLTVMRTLAICTSTQVASTRCTTSSVRTASPCVPVENYIETFNRLRSFHQGAGSISWIWNKSKKESTPSYVPSAG